MATQPTQGNFNDGSMWPDGCPQCSDDTPRYPYMWGHGIARYLCHRCRHAWETAWDDLPAGLSGTNILNARPGA